jgi:hypothetical protein
VIGSGGNGNGSEEDRFSDRFEPRIGMSFPTLYIKKQF